MLCLDRWRGRNLDHVGVRRHARLGVQEHMGTALEAVSVALARHGDAICHLRLRPAGQCQFTFPLLSVLADESPQTASPSPAGDL